MVEQKNEQGADLS